METKHVTIETAKRVYFTGSVNGLFVGYYRPRNPKTGKPWQASRYVGGSAYNAYRLSNHRTGASTPPISGVLADDWHKSGEWTFANSGFMTIDDALAAIDTEIARTNDRRI
jgi:hypothetical protein